MTEMKWKIDIWSEYVRRSRIIFHHLHDEHCTWFALFGLSLFSSFAFMFFYLTYCRMGIWIWCVCLCANRLQDLLCRRHYTNMNMVYYLPLTHKYWYYVLGTHDGVHVHSWIDERNGTNSHRTLFDEPDMKKRLWRRHRKKKTIFGSWVAKLSHYSIVAENLKVQGTSKSTHSFTHSLTKSFALYILRFVSTLNRWMSAESGNIIIHHTRYAVCICVITELPVCGYGRFLSFRI